MRRTPIKRSKRPRRKSAHQELVEEADSWANAIMFDIYGKRCLLAEIQGVQCGGGLQGAHILRKGGMYSSIRYHEENRIPICRNHHIFWAHLYEHDFYEWVEKTFPGRITRLKKIALESTGKIDLKELICVLKSIHHADPPGVTLPISPDLGQEPF
jgi:hypothetical protein